MDGDFAPRDLARKQGPWQKKSKDILPMMKWREVIAIQPFRADHEQSKVVSSLEDTETQEL